MQWCQRNHFFGVFFSIFESGSITKHLMTGPSGDSEFCFPLTSMFSSASSQGTFRVSGKQNTLGVHDLQASVLFISHFKFCPQYPMLESLTFHPKELGVLAGKI